ncbi:MAG: transmembrane 220 family protein [Flavobacteriaceae bacterium]
MKLFFKIFGIVFAALFVYAAIVQYNDPDALKWYVYYGVAAVVSILFAVDKLKLSWVLLLFLFYGFMAYKTWPVKFEGVAIGEGDIVNIERGREALGLGIVVLAMLIYIARLLVARKSKI